MMVRSCARSPRCRYTARTAASSQASQHISHVFSQTIRLVKLRLQCVSERVHPRLEVSRLAIWCGADVAAGRQHMIVDADLIDAHRPAEPGHICVLAGLRLAPPRVIR